MTKSTDKIMEELVAKLEKEFEHDWETAKAIAETHATSMLETTLNCGAPPLFALQAMFEIVAINLKRHDVSDELMYEVIRGLDPDDPDHDCVYIKKPQQN